MDNTVCKKIGRHFWLWPWQHTKRCAVCGAVKNLKVGENTITASPDIPPVTDVLRWSISQSSLNEGDIGMDTNLGRPQAYMHSDNRDLIHADESMAQYETQRLSAPQHSVYLAVDSSKDVAVSISGAFIGVNSGFPVYIEMRPSTYVVGANDFAVIERTRYRIGVGTGEDHVGHNGHGIMYMNSIDSGERHEGWFQSFFWVDDQRDWLTITTQSGHTEIYEAAEYIVTSHAYTRIQVIEDFNLIEIAGNANDFFQIGSRFTAAWWPMKAL